MLTIPWPGNDFIRQKISAIIAALPNDPDVHADYLCRPLRSICDFLLHYPGNLPEPVIGTGSPAGSEFDGKSKR